MTREGILRKALRAIASDTYQGDPRWARGIAAAALQEAERQAVAAPCGCSVVLHLDGANPGFTIVKPCSTQAHRDLHYGRLTNPNPPAKGRVRILKGKPIA